MRAWYIALLPRRIAITLFSNLLPLYIVYTLGRNTVDIGVITAATGSTYIPGSIIWGYIVDKTRRCKFIAVLSIIAYSTLIILFTKAENLFGMITLSLLMGFFGSAIPPIEDILIAEGNSKNRWSEEARSYGTVLEIGDLAGLAIGALLLASCEHLPLIYLCGYLLLSSAVASLFLVEDPIFMVERKIVRLERCINGVEKLSRMLEYQDWYSKRIVIFTDLRIDTAVFKSVVFFGIGALTFTMATDMIFTFITIYLSRVLGIPQNVVFMALILNESGSILGYILLRGLCEAYGGRVGLSLSTLTRAILVLMLIPCSNLPYIAASILDTIILMAMGILYALFALSSMIIRIEIIPEGWMGLYACLVKIGSIIGMTLGGLIIAQYGFNYLFTIAGALFVTSYMLFRFI